MTSFRRPYAWQPGTSSITPGFSFLDGTRSRAAEGIHLQGRYLERWLFSRRDVDWRAPVAASLADASHLQGRVRQGKAYHSARYLDRRCQLPGADIRARPRASPLRLRSSEASLDREHPRSLRAVGSSIHSHYAFFRPLIAFRLTYREYVLSTKLSIISSHRNTHGLFYYLVAAHLVGRLVPVFVLFLAPRRARFVERSKYGMSSHCCAINHHHFASVSRLASRLDPSSASGSAGNAPT